MADDDNKLEVSEKLIVEKQALTEYWTEEAMATAVPIAVDIDDDQLKSLLKEETWRPEGKEETQEPKYIREKKAQAWLPQPKCPSTKSNTQKVTTRSQIPYSPVGKLFMTFNKKNYVGSAWTVANQGVFTAGHCVYDKSNGGWADNILFVPQYDAGTEPLGRWVATQLASLRGWTSNKDFKYDLAAFKVDKAIGNKTGISGWMANYPPNQGCITGIGYPAAPPFDGKNMWSSTGKYIGGSNPIQAWNDMTGGCSGGPWQVWRNGVPYANGVNSFRYNSDPQSMYSPYFGTGFLNLKNWVS